MSSEPIASGIKDLLTSHVSASGWTLEVGGFPKSPDKIIAIMDTGGLPPNPKWLLDFPTVQVTIRGAPNTYLLVWAEGQAVKDLLLGIDSQFVNNDRWNAINLRSDLAYLGTDENDRPTFTLNFDLIVEPLTNSNTNRLDLGEPPLRRTRDGRVRRTRDGTARRRRRTTT